MLADLLLLGSRPRDDVSKQRFDHISVEVACFGHLAPPGAVLLLAGGVLHGTTERALRTSGLAPEVGAAREQREDFRVDVFDAPPRFGQRGFGRLRCMRSSRARFVHETNASQVIEEERQLFERERLRSVAERIFRVRMNVDEQHVRARNGAHRSGVMNIAERIGRAMFRAHGV